MILAITVPTPRGGIQPSQFTGKTGGGCGVGVGSYTAYVNGDLQTFSDSPCAPGLQFINGGCFRSPGTQDTPYGTVAIPIAGPTGNNAIAAGILGGGVTCKTERVDAGPYAYEQNVCRNPAGVIMGGADLVAETAYVQNQLQTLGQPAPRVTTPSGTPPPTPTGSNPIPNSVRPATPNTPPAAMSTTNPTPVQTGTYGTPVGAVATTGAGITNPTAVATSSGPVLGLFSDIPGFFAGIPSLGLGDNGNAILAVGVVGALFLLPKLFGGGRH